MRRSPVPKKLMIYSALVLGAAAFALPFVWMATTSVKTDRELFTRELRIFPAAPNPSPVSPYVDTRYFQDVQGPYLADLLPRLTALIGKTGFKFPADLPGRPPETATAYGLYARLLCILPDSVWNAPLPAVLAAVERTVDGKMVEDVFRRIDRRLIVGPVRVRARSLRETVFDRGPKVIPYDFETTDRIVWTETLTAKGTTFDSRDLQRLRLDLHPDDTWHRLYLTVEVPGVRYRTDRPVPLAAGDWMVVSFQPPGPDDESLTRPRTWVPLKPEGVSGVTDVRQMKLTFEVRKSSSLRAWWEKIALNYRRVLDFIPFWQYVRVSLFLVLSNIILTLLSCSLVAYAFARLHWPGRDFCFALMLATLMIPAQVTMIPNFLIWRYLGLYNTLVPLWLPSAFGVPFYIFLLRQFMKGIPKDLEDAARIDGAGFLRIYWYVILPLIKPSLTAIAIFTFLASWNDFLGPLLYLSDQRLYPLAFGLFAFSVEAGNNPALTMAASLLMTLPVIVIFFFTQRYFIQGITMTGLKGG
jgi:multiple sugar transport system permease protein